MKMIWFPLEDKPASARRGTQKLALSAALGALLVLGGSADVVAQEEDQPAWERIADKLTPNSLEEESSPEELPTVIIDEDGAMDSEDYADEYTEEVSDDLSEYDTGEMGEYVEPVVEALPPVSGAGSSAPESGLDAAAEMEAALANQEAAEEDALAGRMDVSKPNTIGLPQAGRGRSGRNTPNINLGRESDEPSRVVDLFNDPEVRRMLGDKPRFVYSGLDSPDPMIFPPVRNAALYAELSREAERLIKQGKLAQAQERYKRILDLNDKRYMLEMRNKIAQLNNRMGAERMILDDMVVNVKLPPWVRQSTRGILYEESDPMVLVGDYTLHVGDPVPSHPEVRVESISKRKVVYRVSDRESFTVAVKGLQE